MMRLRRQESTGRSRSGRGPGAGGVVAVALLWAIICSQPAPADAAGLLEGEFDNIDLGREMIEPKRFPTIEEFRRAVGKPEIAVVSMFKLFSSGDNYHLPIFSDDGLRMAVQRSDLQADSSKLLLYESLSQAEPTMLSDNPDAYDYMFRWAVNRPAGYAFVRIESGRSATQIYFSPGGRGPQQQVSGAGRHRFPAAYGRTDGIWRLLYDRDGRLMHEAWNDDGPVEPPMVLGQATSPRWSGDGRRVVMARRRLQDARTALSEVVVRDLRAEKEVMLSPGDGAVVRSPTWSPDGRSVAFYVRGEGQGSPWRIRVCPIEKDKGTTLGEDVVVNTDFESQGPAWEPSGQRVWFFCHTKQRQAYYPMVAADVESGQLTVVDYPQRCTTPNDLAINLGDPVPEIVFVAHDGLPKDLFIVFLNHY